MRALMQWFGCLLVVSATVMLAGGCSRDKPKVVNGKTANGKKQDGKTPHVHDHPDHGPHGGALAEWGEEEYHAEFTVDHAKKQATVYILDGSAKKAAPIAAETINLTLTHAKPAVEITLKADPDKDDPKGKSSRFVGTHDKLGEERPFEGEISAKIDDKPYTGSFHEEEEDEHHKKASKEKK
jgi:hypothetical protein